MSDSINALIAGQHNASVIDSLANPPQVNVLGSITRAANAAKSVMDMREARARQLVGEIAANSIDPNTKQFDRNKFNAGIAAAGPDIALAAQDALEKGTSLSTNQLGFNDGQQIQIGKSFGSMINQPDEMQSPAAYKAQLLQLHANGTIDDSHLTAANAAIDALGPHPDPRAMRLTGTRMLMSALSGPDIARQALPQSEMITGPQGVVPYIKQPPPVGGPPTGGMTQAPGGFTAGVAPAPGYVLDTRPGAPPGSYVPAIPPGGGGSQPLPQGGPVAAPAPSPGAAAPQPQPGAPAAASPLPRGAPPLPSGTHLSGGRFGPAPAAAPAPGTPPAAAPVPAPTFTAPPAQQEDVLKKDIETRTTANLAMGGQQERLIAGQTALEALKIAQDTGPGTGPMARAYAFLQAQGVTTPSQGTMSATDYRQLLVKNLLRFAQARGEAAHTDLGLATKLHENANADEMLPLANREVLLQDMGILKRGIAQTREMPAASANGDVVKHVGNFPANTAPEAFMWNEYSQPERDAIEDKYKKAGQTEKLHKSLELAVKHGLIPDPRKTAPTTAVPAAPPPAAPRGRPAAALPNMLNPYA